MLPILTPLLRYPRSRSSEATLAFLQRTSAHPTVSGCTAPTELRCQHLGFPVLQERLLSGEAALGFVER